MSQTHCCRLYRCRLSAAALFLSALTMIGLSSAVSRAADDELPLPELRDELLARVKEDQAARNELVDWMKAHGGGVVNIAELPAEYRAEFEKISARMAKADADNTAWLKGVVEEHGWPTYSLVGKEAAGAAWLLVQHADADPKFQRKCLDLMAKLPEGEVSKSNVAYLTDRVLLAEGKKQLYGTQFTTTDGKLAPRPIEGEANVDARRAAIGLPPLAEYVKRMEEEYGEGK